jgi:regulator of protease activity HflC (stomatin/prohibitin superfamily)
MELVLILALILLLVALASVRRAVIYEFQRGLLFKQGKFVRGLPPGVHYYVPVFRFQSVQVIDVRETHVTLPGQEVLTADNIGLKVTLAAGYRVVDPYLALTRVASYPQALYLLLQLHLRDVIGALEVDALLVQRAEIGRLVFEQAAPRAAEFGVELTLVNVKDMMFPGDLKNIFAQVVNARKEGLAALERARGESAALRNLANAARLLEGNPHLRQLRLLQTLESRSGNTVVVLPEAGLPGVSAPEA